MKNQQIKRRKWIVASATVLILSIGAPLATAQTDAPGGGESSGSYPSPSNLIERTFNNPIIEQVTIIIANRATMTPTFIQGPASVIENIGGFSQVIPAAVTVVRSSGPTLLTIIAALARGAAYG